MKTKVSVHRGRGVESFLTQHGVDVTGVIAWPDRLPLRASKERTGRTFSNRQSPPPRGRNGGAFAVSPANGYGSASGQPPTRSPPAKAGGHARRAAAVPPRAVAAYAAPTRRPRVMGLFSRRPAARYGAAERSELGFWRQGRRNGNLRSLPLPYAAKMATLSANYSSFDDTHRIFWNTDET